MKAYTSHDQMKRIQKIMDSCITMEQLNNCKNMVTSFQEKFNAERQSLITLNLNFLLRKKLILNK